MTSTGEILNIGSFQLPIKSATKIFAILAKRGAGKSYTSAVMAEEFLRTALPPLSLPPRLLHKRRRCQADGIDKLPPAAGATT